MSLTKIKSALTFLTGKSKIASAKKQLKKIPLPLFVLFFLTFSILPVGKLLAAGNPTTPTGLTFSNNTGTSVSLSWTDPDTGLNNPAFYVERAPDNGGTPGTFAQIGTSNTTSYTDSGLSTGTKYFYRVRSLDSTLAYSSYSSGEINTDLGTTGLWHMNETSGTSVADANGTYNGTATGTTVVSGVYGNARNFNGGTDAINLGTSLLNTPTTGTVEMWVKPTANGVSGSTTRDPWRNTTLLSKGNTYLSLEQLPSNQIRAYYYTTSAQYFDSTATLNLNTWNHIAYTWNSSGSTLYINGVKDTTSNLTWSNVSSSSNNQTVDLGYNVSTGDGFVGSMDDVRISNYARSDADVYNDFNGGAVVTSNISSLSPNTGAITGGTAVTLNGSFLPPNSANSGAWSSAGTLPVNLMGSRTAVVGSNIYLFGGSVNGTISNTIYSAPLSNPTNWSNVGTISPVTGGIAYANLAQIGNNLFMFGGENNAGAALNNIYCASISTPTTWYAATNSSAPCYDSGATGTLPTAVGDSQIITIGNTIYLLGGFNGTNSVNSIWTSTTSNPTRWTLSATKTLPDNMASAQSAIIGNYVYIFGYNNYNSGAHHTNWTVYRAPMTNFLGTSAITWTNVGHLPTTLADASLVIVGNTMYMIGGFGTNDTTTGNNGNSGFSNNVYSAPLPDPVNPASTITWSTATTLPGTFAYSSAAVIDNYIYLFGGYNGSFLNNIYKSASLNHYRPNFYNRSWTTNWSSMYPLLYDQSNLTFGGNSATGITYSTNSVTATTPAHFGGKTDVTVTKYDGTTTTYNNGYSFGAPTVSSLSVNNGPAGGGTNLTITGTGFTPPNSFSPPTTTSTWTATATGKTLSTGVGYGATAVIGNYAYIFGGFNGTAPISNIQKIDLTSCSPICSAVETGKTIPSALEAADIAVIGNFIYIFGGHISGAWPGTLSNKIYRAPVSDPTTWTDITALTGKTLPATNAASQLAILGNNIYIFGGYTTTGTTGPTSAIYTASVSDPTTWTTVTGTLPNTLYNHGVAVVNNKAYLIAGYLGGVATNKVYVASCSGSTCSVSDTGFTLPGTTTSAAVAVIGNNVYTFGGYTGSAGSNKIYTAPVDPVNGIGAWTDTTRTLDSVLWNPTATLLINGNIYILGGYNGTSYTNLMRAAPLTQNRPNVYAPSWTTNWLTSADQTNVSIGGVTATNINVASSTSVTATTAAGTSGTKDVVITNADGTSATLSNGYTYSGPTVSSISPNSGPATGGTGVTLTGTNYLLPNSGGASGWTSSGTLPIALMSSRAVVLGDRIYLFGGVNSSGTSVNTIYSAPVSNPTSWTAVGTVAPATSGTATQSFKIIGNTMYLFGGYSSSWAPSNAIYCASTSNPTTWFTPAQSNGPCYDSTHTTLPTAVGDSHLVTIGNYLYLMGGNVAGPLSTNAIWKASLSTPTQWSTTTLTLPQPMTGSSYFLIGNYLYMFGYDNYSAGNHINAGMYRAAISDFSGSSISWTALSGTFSPPVAHSSYTIIGNTMYIMGGTLTTSTFSNTIYSAPIPAPTDSTVNWSSAGTIPTGGNLCCTAFSVINNGTSSNIYLYGGAAASATNTIFKSGNLTQNRPNIYNPSWTTNWPTALSDQTGVTIGGTAATNVGVTDSTHMTATTPAHSPGLADVLAINADGSTGTLSNGFSYGDPVPVTSVTPNSGPSTGGTNVTIGGSNFAAGATVKFNGIAATNVTVVNSTTITATTPANISGAVTVNVTNTDLTAGNLSNGFNYTASSQPTVTSVSPNAGTVAGGTNVTITGTNFYDLPSNHPQVSFNGVAATNVTFVNSTTITATSPASVQAGSINLVITNPDTVTATGTFTYIGAPASLTAAAGGEQVTLNWSAATGNETSGVSYVLEQRTPPSTGTYAPVTLIDPSATSVVITGLTPLTQYQFRVKAQLSGSFGPYSSEVTSTPTAQAPTIGLLSVDSGSAAGGTSITVNGTNFYSGAIVKFGGTLATGVTVVSSTQITATTPAHTAGTVDVTVTNTDNQTGTKLGGFTYLAAPTSLTATAISGGANLSWTAPAGNETTPGLTYNVEYRTPPNSGTFSTYASNISGTTASVTGLTTGNAYEFRVIAVSGNGTGAYSNSATAYMDYIPAISSISPVSGVTSGGGTLTIQGTNLVANSYGNGADGSVTLSSNTNINTDVIATGRTCADAINYSVTALTANTATLSTTPAAGCLAASDEILLINLQGTPSATVNVGNYETLRIQSISGNTITFNRNKTKYYGTGANDDINLGTTAGNQKVMLQRVPNYNNLTINSGVNLTASAWDGTKGGVLFFKANGSVVNNGTINMNGLGYSGGSLGSNGGGIQGNLYGGAVGADGVSTTTNNNTFCGAGGGGGGGSGSYASAGSGGGGGGAGGTCASGAGAAGGNASGSTGGTGGIAGINNGSGGNGGNGQATTYGQSALTQLYMGTGGGAGGSGGTGGNTGTPHAGGVGGAGGAGGGIILINANQITTPGNIQSNGGNGTAGTAGATLSGGNVKSGGGGAAGGAGAGGSILINAANAINIGTNKLVAGGGVVQSGASGGVTNSNPGPGAGNVNGGGGGAGGNTGTVGGLGGTVSSSVAGSGRIAVYSTSVTGVTSPTAYTSSSSLLPVVKIGTLTATNVTVVNSTTITATIPAGSSGSSDVSITNLAGQSTTLSAGYTYYPPNATVSDAPTALSATSTSGQAVLSWTAPVYTGNISLSSYTIRYGLVSDSNCSLTTAGAAGCTEITGISPSSSSYTITNLTNGVNYKFTVFAINAVGASAAATQATTTPGTVSGAPTNLASHAEDNGDITLTWTAPSDNGGFAISDYILQYKKTTDAGFTTLDLSGLYSENQNTVTYVKTGLTTRQSYLFQVAAVNSRGTSSYSTQTSTTPILIGDDCSSVETLDSTPEVSHSQTFSNTNYGVDLLSGDSYSKNDRIEMIPVPAHSTLKIGFSYHYTYDSHGNINAAVQDSNFTTVHSITEATPGSCTNGSAAGTAISASDSLTYVTPTYGGLETRQYTYINNSSSTKNIYWVTAGWLYSFNQGNFTLNWEVTQPSTNLNVPQAVSWNSTGNNQLTLNWNPAGGTVQDYVIEYRPYPFTGSFSSLDTGSTNTLATITGLNDTPYEFRIKAQNGASSYGPYSDSYFYHPGDDCSDPDILVDSPAGDSHSFSGTTVGYTSTLLTTGYNQNYLSHIGSAEDRIHRITVPAFNILNIGTSNYAGKITRIAVADSCSNGSPAGSNISSPDTLTPAQNSGGSDSSNTSTFHYYNNSASAKNIYWVNAGGIGYTPTDYTLTWSINPPAVPGAPTGLSATTASGQAHLTWTAPSDDGGAPISSYIVHYSQDNFSNESTSTVSGSSTSTTITGLTNGITYKFKVVANNSAGDSLDSNIVSATPQNLPPTISSISPNGAKSAGGDTVTINGANFLSGASISIDGGNISNVNFIDNNHLSFTTPAHAAGTFSVTVTNPDSQSVTSNNSFTFYDAPTLTSVSPIYATTAGNTAIDLTGTNFRSGATVTIGGVSANPSVYNSTSITVLVPAGLPLGDQTITVTNPAPDQQQASLPSDAFTIYPTGPIQVINPPGTDNLKFSMSAGQNQTITFNKPLTSASKTVVEEAISASDGQSLTYTWNSRNTAVTVQAGSTAASVFDNNVYAVSLTDVFNITTNNVLLIKSTPKVYQSEIASAVNLESGITEAVVNQSIPATITIPAATSAPTINVKPLLYTNDTATLPNLQINRTTDQGSVIHVNIPSGTNVTATNSSTWDGTLDITHVLTSNDVQTYIPTPPGGLVANATGFRMGKSDNTLLFQKAVRLQFEGMSSKSVGYIENGSFHAISTICSADTQNSADAVLPYPSLDQNGNIISHSECKIAVGTNGSDWAVWTKHFTDFVFYDEILPPTVTSVSPNTGDLAGGNSVIIAGSNFGTGATVEFGSGNTSPSVTVDSNTQITATVPAGTARGSVTVIVTNPNTLSGSKANGYTYAVVPGAPVLGTTTPGNAQVYLAWGVPTDNGGSAITGYTVRYSPTAPVCDLSVTVTNNPCYSEIISDTTTSKTVTGLTNDTAYQFAVFANNAVGLGAASNIHTATPVAPAGPSVPAASVVSLSAGDGQITVSWTAPDNGGSPITSYTIRYGKTVDGCNPSGELNTGCQPDIIISSTDPEFTSRSKVLTGLVNGSAYNVAVVTTNAVGSSYSASVTATPSAAPAVPSSNTNATQNIACNNLTGDQSFSVLTQAFPDANTVSFETRTTDFYNRTDAPLDSNQYVQLVVTDNRGYDPGATSNCGSGYSYTIQSNGLYLNGNTTSQRLALKLGQAVGLNKFAWNTSYGPNSPISLGDVFSSDVTAPSGDISTAVQVTHTSESFLGQVVMTLDGNDLEVIKPDASIPAGNYSGTITFTQI